MQIYFDRGTVVVESATPDAQVDTLKDMRWDARIGCYRAPAHRYRDIVTSFRARGLSYRDVVRTQRVQTGPWRDVALRPYQHAALLAWDREKRGLIVMPTGSGKTRLACAAMAACRVPALCLVPTRSLLHQWRNEIACHYGGAIGCLGDGDRTIEDITVATFEGAYRQMPRLGHRFGLLIVDEVHHFGAGVRDEALEMCAAPRRLALTATAPAEPALQRVVDMMGPIVCELSVAELAGEWLADFENVVLALRLTRAEQNQYDAALRAFRQVFDRFKALHRNARWRDFVSMAARSAEGRTALAAFRLSRRLTSYPHAKRQALGVLLSQHRGSRMLVFTSDNETAYAIAREHLIMPMTCDIDRQEREEALAAFRAGQLTALVSDAEVAVIVGGVHGTREHVQRVGRLLRPSPGKQALVYELVITGTHEVRSASKRRRALQPANREHA
jgi:superfamily II DNA or RNA helicase